MQTAIPCLVMRGGTSKGPFFLSTDLPGDVPLRDRILLAAMGSPDRRQIDGLGGAHPLTSKVAIVSRSLLSGVDLDFLFCQVVVDEARVDTSQNCGNMLAGVGPFAIETGLVPASVGETVVSIRTVNTGVVAEATVQTPGGRVTYEGPARIDGVPGTAAPIMLSFRETQGSTCGTLLPSGHIVDELDGISVTCIDNGMPVVVCAAAALGRTGYETPAELNGDEELKGRVESIRLQAGRLMGLGNVAQKNIPKVSLVAPPRAGGSICTRTFIPRVCHEAVGVLGAVSVATACRLAGSPAAQVAVQLVGARPLVSVEHPTGEFTVELETTVGPDGSLGVGRAALLRTARPIMRGMVLVPRAVWDGRLA